MLTTVDIDIETLGRLIGEADALYSQKNRDNWWDADDMMREAAGMIRDALLGHALFAEAYENGRSCAAETEGI